MTKIDSQSDAIVSAYQNDLQSKALARLDQNVLAKRGCLIEFIKIDTQSDAGRHIIVLV